MKIIIPNRHYDITEFYDAVATEMGYEKTKELSYDCRCINVAANIQDGFYEHYRKTIKGTAPNEDDNTIQSSITMLLAMYGPKVDKNLNENEVEVFDGFIS